MTPVGAVRMSSVEEERRSHERIVRVVSAAGLCVENEERVAPR